MKPSSTNGQRMNQLVAPTSCMISTSRRRAKMDRRTVVEVSRMAARANSTVTTHIAFSMRLTVPSRLRTVCFGIAHAVGGAGVVVDVGVVEEARRHLVDLVGVLTKILYEAGSGLVVRLFRIWSAFEPSVLRSCSAWACET